MEIKQTLILETTDSVSKALPQLDEHPAVIVTKKGRYYGIIDHHSLSQNVREPHNTKCETVVVRPPVLFETAQMFDQMEAFLTGHYKALPVINKDHRPLGITTRVELLKEMVKNKMIPQLSVSEIMSSPVQTVDEKDSVGTVKRIMKESRLRRLVVTSNDSLIGIVSAYDVGAWSNRPNLFSTGRKDIKHLQINVDGMRISEFLRPDVALVEEGANVQAAVKKMVDKQVSAVIITSEGKPVGVLSALDIFKTVHEMTKDGIRINVAGLNDDNMNHYNHINDKIGHVLEKYIKTFNIRNCNVHVKEGKSSFDVNLNFDTDHGHLSMKSEGEFLKECIDEVAEEADIVLGKKREKVKPKIKRRED
ncbi:CBS domain protein [Candidatus Bilamarchaeum dharawalense]|uniref:CBS domain protein n=1 Tax=Candidatus Bilamarchaeum dharawalense TaxID=2885759 RepID=A0A5E4LS29_9ARCH|nr:CBS domain protein [Candidatus Bilamarchaeum dharawalense]